MKTSDFSFELPERLIAQTPLPDRTASRLLRLDKASGEIQHHQFAELPSLLCEGDLLVVNDSRVLPARLLGVTSGGGACEILLLRQREEDLPLTERGVLDGGGTPWECIVRPGRKLREGAKAVFGDGRLTAEIMSVQPDGNRLVRFRHEGIFMEVLDELGEMPLPPYIHERLREKDRYQTVYAKTPGSAAAPTAGLHFTEALFAKLEQAGVNLASVTLHVGLGTFRPVKVERVEDHRMHAEWFTLPPETEAAVRETRARGGRVIAVGTTVCRVLESCAAGGGLVTARSGETEIFITPGYGFQVIDGLITNFHLPESTLIMLVSALAGRERTLKAYREVVREDYRFFSFGDAMLIIDMKK